MPALTKGPLRGVRHARFRVGPPAAGGALVASIALAAGAEIITIDAAADNTLYEDKTGAASNGAGSHFFAGTNLNGRIRRALLRFDVHEYLPPGVIIESATLTLHLSRTISATEEVSLHRALADWGEGASDALGEEGGGAPATTGDATWIHRQFDTELWIQPGGDFAELPTAEMLVASPGYYSWSSQAMATEIRDWLDAPAANFGWIIIGNEGAPSTAKRFDSRENEDPSHRPRLTITYSIPAPPIAFVVSSLALILARRR